MKFSFSEAVSALRSINQTLVFTSLTLVIIVILAQKPDEITAAIDELHSIQRLASEKNWNPQFVDDAFRALPGISLDRYTFYTSWSIILQKEELSIVKNILSPVHSIDITAPFDVFEGWPYPETGEFTNVSAPQTIAEFSDIWDRAQRVNVLHIDRILNYAYVQVFPSYPVEKVPLTIENIDYVYSQEDGSGFYGVFVPNIYEDYEIDAKDRKLYGLTTAYDHGDRFFYRIWIPAETRDENYYFDARFELCDKLKNSKILCDGTFAQSFPNLYLNSQNYRDLKLENVILLLEREREKRLQNFDFLGIKLPMYFVNGFGACVLIALQIYLFLHLRTLTKIPSSGEIPVWIGIFPDWFSRSLSVTSVTFVPILSIFILNLTILSNQFASSIMHQVLLYSSILISILIITEFVFVWKNINRQGVEIIKSPRKHLARKNRNQ